jgi:hypothetical protein
MAFVERIVRTDEQTSLERLHVRENVLRHGGDDAFAVGAVLGRDLDEDSFNAGLGELGQPIHNARGATDQQVMVGHRREILPVRRADGGDAGVAS